ncbi:MAG: hypothetical protein ACJASC_003381 [Limimaricola cinnabarinus]|jgi:hypothetical protein
MPIDVGFILLVDELAQLKIVLRRLKGVGFLRRQARNLRAGDHRCEKGEAEHVDLHCVSHPPYCTSTLDPKEMPSKVISPVSKGASLPALPVMAMVRPACSGILVP